MADKIDVLTGYDRPFRDDPLFILAMARCNDARNFIPLQKRKIYGQEKAEELNGVVKKRRGK